MMDQSLLRTAAGEGQEPSHGRFYDDNGFSTRTIMSLMEVLRMEEFAARIRVQVAAPAREHGLIMPLDEQTSRDGFFRAFAAIK